MAAIVFAALVFCFWFFLYPHLMAWREGSQLFLCNKEYLFECLAIPGGLAQYIAEALVQFFANARLGALAYALLLALTQWLTWKAMQRTSATDLSEKSDHSRQSAKTSKPWRFLLSFVPAIILCWLATNPYIPTTPLVAVVLVLVALAFRPKGRKMLLAYTTLLIPIGYWLVGPAILLVALCNWRWALPQWALLAACVVGFSFLAPFPLRQQARGIDYFWQEEYKSTMEEMKYDRWMRMGRWGRIVDEANKKTPEAQSSRNVVQMALWNLKRLSSGNLFKSLDPSPIVMQSTAGAFIMSDIYLQLGYANMSQRAAFEAMESIPNHNKSGRALKRLTETAIVAGQLQLARKYLTILEDNVVLRKWARETRQLTETPEAANSIPFYRQMRQHFSESDNFFFY